MCLSTIWGEGEYEWQNAKDLKGTYVIENVSGFRQGGQESGQLDILVFLHHDRQKLLEKDSRYTYTDLVEFFPEFFVFACW